MNHPTVLSRTVLPGVLFLVLVALASCELPKASGESTVEDSGGAVDGGIERQDTGQNDTGQNDTGQSDTAQMVSDAVLAQDITVYTQDACQPDCANKICGDDGCGGSCGSCTGAQEMCAQGTCVCQPDCAGKDCGSDGCNGSCGSCNPTTQTCNGAQICVDTPCETAVCGVCDEIDGSTIVGWGGGLGADHGNGPITAAVLNWPITTELEVAFPAGTMARFTISHFPGESWSIYNGGTTEGAGMVACWDKVGTGIYCLGWDWWTMGHGGYKSFDWPVDRPIAHMLFSVADQKRTNIKYFETWPHNNVVDPDAFNANTVGTSLVRRNCR